MFPDDIEARFAREVAKYPEAGKQSAVVACLSIVQQVEGHVSTQRERELAAYLGMAPIAVHEVMTFYNMYNQRPVGRFKLSVCTNLPCQLRNGQHALRHLETKLDIRMGETTPDGVFTLQQSECLGACADSPVLLVNDRSMCSFMSGERLDGLVDGLRACAEGGDEHGRSSITREFPATATRPPLTSNCQSMRAWTELPPVAASRHS